MMFAIACRRARVSSHKGKCRGDLRRGTSLCASFSPIPLPSPRSSPFASHCSRQVKWQRIRCRSLHDPALSNGPRLRSRALTQSQTARPQEEGRLRCLQFRRRIPTCSQARHHACCRRLLCRSCSRPLDRSGDPHPDPHPSRHQSGVGLRGQLGREGPSRLAIR